MNYKGYLSFATLVAALATHCPVVLASEAAWFAKRSNPAPTKKIDVLEWPISDDVEVEVTTQTGQVKIFAIVTGKLKKGDHSLLIGGQKIAANPQGGFKFKIPMTSDKASVLLTNVAPSGTQQTETVAIAFPKFQEVAKAGPTSTKRLSVMPGLGVSSILYKQTDFPNLSEIMLTLKVGAIFSLNNYWDLGLNAFGNLLPINVSIANKAIRFFGANFRVGFALPFIREPFRIAILGGFYYTTTILAPGFGFSNMSGPQIFPTFRFRIGERHVVNAYFKFSPVASSFSLLTLGNREMAAGGGYTYVIGGKFPLSFMFDYANIRLDLDGAIADSTSLSFSVGTSL